MRCAQQPADDHQQTDRWHVEHRPALPRLHHDRGQWQATFALDDRCQQTGRDLVQQSLRHPPRRIPRRPRRVTQSAALSYPYAIEHEGKLYVGYSNSGDKSTRVGTGRELWNNNSAELAVIPIDQLRVDEGSLSQTEPTNVKEAAAMKAREEAELDQKYQAWVAKLTPAQQAWEKTLQAELGNFYLPIHKREKVAGKSNAWDFVEDDPACRECFSLAIQFHAPTRKRSERNLRESPTCIELRPTAVQRRPG